MTIYKNKQINILLFALLLICSPKVYSMDDEVGYDQILKELSRSRTNYRSSQTNDPFEFVKFLFGVNAVNSSINLGFLDGDRTSGFYSGVEANFGIDLLSPYWKAEGSVRTFQDKNLDQVTIGLKEFDLKLVHTSYISKNFTVSKGIGLAARYLNVKRSIVSKASLEDGVDELTLTDTDYVTPSSLFFVGLHAWLNKNISVGTELSYRTTMVTETVDQNSLDLSVRIDTRF